MTTILHSFRKRRSCSPAKFLPAILTNPSYFYKALALPASACTCSSNSAPCLFDFLLHSHHPFVVEVCACSKFSMIAAKVTYARPTIRPANDRTTNKCLTSNRANDQPATNNRTNDRTTDQRANDRPNDQRPSRTTNQQANDRPANVRPNDQRTTSE